MSFNFSTVLECFRKPCYRERNEVGCSLHSPKRDATFPPSHIPLCPKNKREQIISPLLLQLLAAERWGSKPGCPHSSSNKSCKRASPTCTTSFLSCLQPGWDRDLWVLALFCQGPSPQEMLSAPHPAEHSLAGRQFPAQGNLQASYFILTLHCLCREDSPQ